MEHQLRQFREMSAKEGVFPLPGSGRVPGTPRMLQLHPLEEETPPALWRGPTQEAGLLENCDCPGAQCGCSDGSAGGGGTVGGAGCWILVSGQDGLIAVGHVPGFSRRGLFLSHEVGF